MVFNRELKINWVPMHDGLENISEAIRSQLYAAEGILHQTDRLSPNSSAERKLKHKLSEHIKTKISDLLIMNEFLIESLNCYDSDGTPNEMDLEFIVRTSDESEME